MSARREFASDTLFASRSHFAAGAIYILQQTPPHPLLCICNFEIDKGAFVFFAIKVVPARDYFLHFLVVRAFIAILSAFAIFYGRSVAFCRHHLRSALSEAVQWVGRVLRGSLENTAFSSCRLSLLSSRKNCETNIAEQT